MRAHDDIVGYIEGILHIPCRMVFGHIQCFEIIIVVLDFRAFLDAEPHRNKDGGYFRQDLGNRMFFAKGSKLAGQRDINSIREDAFFVLFLFESRLSPDDFFIDKPFDFIDRLAVCGFFFRRDCGKSLEFCGHKTLFPEIFHFSCWRSDRDAVDSASIRKDCLRERISSTAHFNF